MDFLIFKTTEPEFFKEMSEKVKGGFSPTEVCKSIKEKKKENIRNTIKRLRKRDFSFPRKPQGKWTKSEQVQMGVLSEFQRVWDTASEKNMNGLLTFMKRNHLTSGSHWIYRKLI